MGLENFVETLYSSEDALMLCEGKLRSQSGYKFSLVSDRNVLDAAEILIVLDDADNICSRSDVIERAIAHGWFPPETNPISKPYAVKSEGETEASMSYGWRSALFKTAKFLLKVSSM